MKWRSCEILTAQWSEKWRTLLLLSLIALIPRLCLLFICVDAPGDNTTRAIYAYSWSKSPHLLILGPWPPGMMYLAGAANWLIPSPILASRILNLFLGTLTIPFFFVLVEKLHRRSTALLSSSILAVFPQHVALSVTSLAEISLVFETVAGLLLLILAAERKGRWRLYLGLALLSISWAGMTRYEAWALIPIVPVYWLMRTRRVFASICMLGLLAALPAAWVVYSYVKVGEFLGYSLTHVPVFGARPVDAITAIKILSNMVVAHTGWIVPILAICGIGLGGVHVVKRRRWDPGITAYFLLFLCYWLYMVRLTMERGPSFLDRYLLFGMVMLLPFSALPLVSWLREKRLWLLTAAMVVGFSVGACAFLQFYHLRPDFFVARQLPPEITDVAQWIQQSHYHGPLLFTLMNFRSSYLPLLLRMTNDQFKIIWEDISDSQLESFITKQGPHLLITGDSDRDARYRARLEGIMKHKISPESLLHAAGDVKVYDIQFVKSTG